MCGIPPSSSANGNSMMPPIVNCQPASTIGSTAGEPHFLSNTVATAMIAVAASAAATPSGSIPCTLGPSKSTRPMTTAAAAPRVCATGRCASIPQARPITKTGAAAPSIEATLPGRWYAAKNRSGKNAPKLRAASTADFHHHSPLGNWRENATISRPIGSDRTSESSSGRPGGRKSVVRRKFVPHTRGAMAVTRISVSRRISSP